MREKECDTDKKNVIKRERERARERERYRQGRGVDEGEKTAHINRLILCGSITCMYVA